MSEDIAARIQKELQYRERQWQRYCERQRQEREERDRYRRRVESVRWLHRHSPSTGPHGEYVNCADIMGQETYDAGCGLHHAALYGPAPDHDTALALYCDWRQEVYGS